MAEERDFVQMLSFDPKDNDARLIYADWLEERADPVSLAKAEFLRLSVEIATTTPIPFSPRPVSWNQIQKLAIDLDTGWLARVSHLAVENCQRPPQGARRPPRKGLLQFVCSRRWESLGTTDQDTVRFCDSCQQSVYYCGSILEAREHAQQGHCVAVDLAIPRRREDLEGPRMWLGRPGPEVYVAEEARLKPDPVSVAREARKQARAGGT